MRVLPVGHSVVCTPFCLFLLKTSKSQSSIRTFDEAVDRCYRGLLATIPVP